MENIRSKYTHPDFQFARFRLSEHEFCINVKNLKEVIRCRNIVPAAGMPSFMEGVVNLRGISVPVIDLRKRFFLKGGMTELTRIMIISIEGHIAGFIVDEVKDIVTGGKEVMHRPGRDQEPWAGCIEADLETGTKSIMVITPSALITEAEKELFNNPIARP